MGKWKENAMFHVPLYPPRMCEFINKKGKKNENIRITMKENSNPLSMEIHPRDSVRDPMLIYPKQKKEKLEHCGYLYGFDLDVPQFCVQRSMFNVYVHIQSQSDAPVSLSHSQKTEENETKKKWNENLNWTVFCIMLFFKRWQHSIVRCLV